MEEYEEKIRCFDKYLKQTIDILKDSFRWKTMAEHCDDNEIKNKYMNVSNILYELFMQEHNNIGNMFKGQ